MLKKELFTSPVIIESVELLRWENSYLCRVRSADGAEGISVAHSGMSTLYPIFLHNLQPFFLGKDARELDLILEKVYIYGFNFRYNGISLGLPLATIEFAILDLLGRIAGRSLGQLIGEIHHPEVAVYVATEWRERPLEETVDRIKKAVAEYDAKALKIKVGYLMFMTTDMHAKGPVGKTERLIPLLRETLRERHGALRGCERLLRCGRGDPGGEAARGEQVCAISRSPSCTTISRPSSRWPTP